MEELHEAYLSLGSNIDPERNLPEAIRLLSRHGQVKAVSSAWQSHAVGSSGPDFLNACILLLTPLPAGKLVKQVLRPIEAEMGRVRGPDKNAPRTIDIDLILFDDDPHDEDFWTSAFVIVPLAELLPNYPYPLGYEDLATVSSRVQRQIWIVPRREVLSPLGSS